MEDILPLPVCLSFVIVAFSLFLFILYLLVNAGTEFGANPSVIIVSVGDYECSNISFVQLHEKLTCYMPAGSGGSYAVNLTVDGQSTLGPLFSYIGIVFFFFFAVNLT